MITNNDFLQALNENRNISDLQPGDTFENSLGMFYTTALPMVGRTYWIFEHMEDEHGEPFMDGQQIIITTAEALAFELQDK